MRMELFWILCALNANPELNTRETCWGNGRRMSVTERVAYVIGYFSCFCEQIPDESNLQKEEFILTHSVMVQPVAGEVVMARA